MNFPMDEPFFRFAYWLMNTPGLGGIAVLGVVTLLATIFISTLFWLSRGGSVKETDTYSYPTPALHHH